MNTLRRVCLVVISCIILLLALLCPVSAASFTMEDDLIINDDLMLMPNGTLSNGNIATTDLSSPNFRQFNPNMLPWKNAPDYVKEILLANINDINKQGNPLDFSEPAKVPFVCVRVTSSNIMVYVGWNICVLYLDSSNRPVIGRVVLNGYDLSNSLDVKMLSSTLYRATFNFSDLSVITPWYDASNDLNRIDSWDNNLSYVFTYTGSLVNETNKYDLYFYGANYAFWYPSGSSSGSLNAFKVFGPLGPDNSNNVTFSYNLPLGFESGTFFYNSSRFVNTYCSYFVPKTMPDVNTGVVGDHSAAEDALVNGYNPDNLTGDINITVDSDAWGAIFSIFNLFISGNAVLVSLIVTMLSLGFIALLLNR